MEEESWNEPLLGKKASSSKERDGSSSAAVNLLFLKRIWRIMRIAKCGDCVLLLFLSVLDVAILSQAGLVVGHFYNALITKDAQLFVSTVAEYLMWYSGEAICKGAQVWAAEWLSIGWRRNLTQAAHHSYCSLPSMCRLSQRQNCLDNPDERITNEIICLCQTLANLMLKTVAAPLMILYYTWWVAYHAGWFGPVIIYTIFVTGAVVSRWIISPIANLVARQEKLEAIFRIAHVRFLGRAEAIAMSDSARYEEVRLEENLQSALSNRRKLVSKHFQLGVFTNVYDYLGGVVNYIVLAIPVFGGIFDSDDSGQLANLISNASFAVLQLIYSFSQVLDTAKLVSDLAGYTSRVGELFEMLDILPQSKESCELSAKPEDTCPIFEEGILDAVVVEKDVEVCKDIFLISPPTCLGLREGCSSELSIHFCPPALHEGLSNFFTDAAPASLLIVPAFMTPRVIQDLDLSISIDSLTDQQLPEENLTINPKIDQANGHPKIFKEFLVTMIQTLRELGHWTNALEPSTGNTLSYIDEGEEQGLLLSRVLNAAALSIPRICSAPDEEQSRFHQVDAVKLLLGYTSIEADCVSVIRHPRLGDGCLMSSIFTTAPAKVIQSALNNYIEGVAASCEARTEPMVNALHQTAQSPSLDILTTCNLLPALAVDRMTFFLPGSHMPVVQNLTVQLQWGESLLVMGPTGCGKTSLLRAMCGLWPVHSGTIRMPPLLGGNGALVLPQLPIMAKMGLAGQILYPDLSPGKHKLSPPDIVHLQNALEAVGMRHFEKQLKEDLEMGSDWADDLSPGERQSLALARVIYRGPQLVILDEATSALSEDAEDAIYKRMIDMGISIISVGHRSRLRRHHSKLLVLFGDGSGGWSLS